MLRVMESFDADSALVPTDRGLATVLHVALKLGKPLLLEGEAGVGKTEVAKTLADVLGARLIRLQCYEGIDVAPALYDWSRPVFPYPYYAKYKGSGDIESAASFSCQ